MGKYPTSERKSPAECPIYIEHGGISYIRLCPWSVIDIRQFIDWTATSCVVQDCTIELKCFRQNVDSDCQRICTVNYVFFEAWY